MICPNCNAPMETYSTNAPLLQLIPKERTAQTFFAVVGEVSRCNKCGFTMLYTEEAKRGHRSRREKNNIEEDPDQMNLEL